MRVCLLFSLAPVCRAPYAKPALWNSIRDGTAIREFNRVIAPASPDMIIGDEPCSPCYPVAPDPGLDVRGADGKALESRESKRLLAHKLPGNLQQKYLLHHDYHNLLDDRLLYVLWAIDPSSYFFACLTDDHKLQPVPTPAEANARRVPSQAVIESHACGRDKRIQSICDATALGSDGDAAALSCACGKPGRVGSARERLTRELARKRFVFASKFQERNSRCFKNSRTKLKYMQRYDHTTHPRQRVT
jgi:hypothetical protein